MKNFEVVGHIKAFDDPEFCEAVNNLVEEKSPNGHINKCEYDRVGNIIKPCQ